MYPVTSSQNAPFPVERRHNPRHKTSSIIYVRIGSDNGGIVIDLGRDGLACQAARKMSVEGNTDLKLQLNGSGLDVDLTGELVWLGASKKEVGFCFKNTPDNVKQVIADWIEQQSNAFGFAAVDDPPRLKPLPAIPGMRAVEKKSAPLSLSAALTMSKAISMDAPTNVDLDSEEARIPARLDSAAGIFGSSQLLEFVTPIKQAQDPAGELDARPKSPTAYSFVSPEPHHVEKPLQNEPPLELSAIEDMHPSPADNSFPVVLCVEPIPPKHQELPQTPEKTPADSEIHKTEGMEPAPQPPVSRPPVRVLQPTLIEKWIPPALLHAWRQKSRQQKFLIANTAAACVLAFALVFTITVAHTGNSSESGAVRESTATPATPSASVVSPQTGSLQPPPVPRATPRPRSHQPPTSLLANLSKILLGDKPAVQKVIDEDQVGVQVWTSKTSGYYYCTDSPFYNTVQPGAFMTQGDALQSGYQPKLGQFCN